MDRYHDNSYGTADASRTPSRMRTVRLSNSGLGQTGDLSAAQASADERGAAAPARPRTRASEEGRSTARRTRSARAATGGAGPSASRGTASRTAASYGESRGGRRTRRPAADVMKYAADNRAVQAVYNFTHGATRPLFIVIVVAAVLAGVYGPVRDCYSAYRTGDILNRQLELVKSYNADLQGEVDTLLSREGIEDAARKELNLVMPGEKTLTVTGDGGSSSADTSSSDSSSSITADELEQKVAAVPGDSPWYIKMLDTLFGYAGPSGQSVTSAGTAASK